MTTSLEGLRPKPLSRYLCALGVLRLVAEQHDPTVVGRWRQGCFELGGIEIDDLCEFFVSRYSPTPVFSPWNKEGNPRNPKSLKVRRQLDQIRDASDSRFDPYRLTLGAFDSLADSVDWGVEDKKKDQEKKSRALKLWRSRVPNVAVPWIDAAAVLTTEDVGFPPLLGTGGNDGRLEFSRRFQAELIRLLLDQRSSQDALGWIRALLTGSSGGPPLVDSSLGQFDAHSSGGINSGALESAKPATNPWALVLTIEGLIALGPGVSSRLGVGRRSLMAVPFMVHSSYADAHGADGEVDHGEFWAPLWSRPARWSELRLQLAEGRLQWHGQRASTAVDAARAVGSLGTNRGIDVFERFGLVKRNGDSFVATSRGALVSREVRGVPLLGAIDDWLARACRAGSAAILARRRGVDRAQLDVIRCDGGAGAFESVLIALARLERTVGQSAAARERVYPFPGELLRARDWLTVLDDGTPELRIAAGLASLRDTAPEQVGEERAPSERIAALAFRQVTRPSASKSRALWPEDDQASDSAVWEFRRAGPRPCLALLTRRLHRAIDVTSADAGDDPFIAPFRKGLTVPIGDLERLISGELDLDRVRALIPALSLLDDWPAQAPWKGDKRVPVHRLPAWFALVRHCLHHQPIAVAGGERRWVFASRGWGRLLSSCRGEDVARDAARRLARLGVTPLRVATPPTVASDSAETCAAALLCHLSEPDLTRLRAVIDPFAPFELIGAQPSHRFRPMRSVR